jgi:hypothetical protein
VFVPEADHVTEFMNCNAVGRTLGAQRYVLTSATLAADQRTAAAGNMWSHSTIDVFEDFEVEIIDQHYFNLPPPKSC